MVGDLLPLFPLPVVLFPQMTLPLHIFEPRYKQMIGRCLEKKEEFGLLLAQAGGLASVGCTAKIVQVVKKYPDGRLDIVTTGRRRFGVVELSQELAYLQARVSFLEDESSPEQGVAALELIDVWRGVVRLLAGKRPPTPEGLDEAMLSFHLAALLPLDLTYKQELLELSSEAERRRSLLGKMNEMSGRLKQIERVKGLAGGNGHAR